MSETGATVAELVKTFLIEAVGVQPELLQNPVLKLDELGVDSLSAAEMLYEVEDRFGVNIKDTSMLKTMTVDEVIVYFQQLVDAKQAAAATEEAIAIAPIGAAA